jgi:AAA+ ATPase superfamily predicted ATPase
MHSPFPYETYAEATRFYGRSDELKRIAEYAKTSSNLVIYSKRRMGKSSLIKEAFRGEEKRYLCIYCDIFDITSKEEFAAALLKALADSVKGDVKNVVNKLGALFKRVRVEYTVDPRSGKIGIRPVVKALSFEEMLEDFFTTLYHFAEKQKVVLAIDEFQQISTVRDAKIAATLRKYIQENREIAYVFLGSKRHMLSRLFEYGAPLFEEATPLLLGPIALDDVYRYVSGHLRMERRLIERIYELADGETKLMQHIFHILYMSRRDETISEAHVESAVNEIINAKSSGYRVIFDSFSQYQKKAFKALAKYARGIHSKEVLDEFGISKGSMQSALKQLHARELVDKEEEAWFIPDRAFELWGKSL